MLFFFVFFVSADNGTNNFVAHNIRFAKIYHANTGSIAQNIGGLYLTALFAARQVYLGNVARYNHFRTETETG